MPKDLIFLELIIAWHKQKHILTDMKSYKSVVVCWSGLAIAEQQAADKEAASATMEDLLRCGLQHQQGQYGRDQASWADQVLASAAAWGRPTVPHTRAAPAVRREARWKVARWKVIRAQILQLLERPLRGGDGWEAEAAAAAPCEGGGGDLRCVAVAARLSHLVRPATTCLPPPRRAAGGQVLFSSRDGTVKDSTSARAMSGRGWVYGERVGRRRVSTARVGVVARGRHRPAAACARQVGGGEVARAASEEAVARGRHQAAAVACARRGEKASVRSRGKEKRALTG